MERARIIRKDISFFLSMDGFWSFLCSLLEAALLIGAAYYLLYGILLIGLLTITVASPLFAALLPAMQLPVVMQAVIEMVLTALPQVDYVPSFVLYFFSGALSLLYLFLLRGAVNSSAIWLVVVIGLLILSVMAFPLGPGIEAYGEYIRNLQAMKTATAATMEEIRSGLELSAFRPPNLRTLISATLIIPTIVGVLGLCVALLRMSGALFKALFPIVRQGMRFRLPFTGVGLRRYQWRRLAPAGVMLGRIGANLLGITALGPICVIYWLALAGLLNLLPETFLEDTSEVVDYVLAWVASIVFFLPVWIYIFLHQRRRIGSARLLASFVVVNFALIVVLSILYEYAYGENLVSAVIMTIAIFIGYAARLTFFSSLLEAMDDWRMRSRVSAAQLMEVSKVPPILFLRTFDEDDLWLRVNNRFDRIVFAHRRWRARLEEVVADASFAYGPVIALSNPKLGLQPLGAARENVSDEHWQDYVTKYIDESQIVILCLGKTENVRWEIERILALDAAEKLIVVLPTSYPKDRTITEVSAVLAERLGIPDTEFEAGSLRRAHAIYFDRKRGGHVALMSRQRGERAYATIMRSALSGTRKSRRLATQPSAEA